MRCCTKNWLLVYLVLLLAASAIQKSTVWKLADEKRCRVFWNLCGELLYDVEDSSILECLKAIHTEHNNSYSYDCEPIIWGYTKHIISDAVVLKLAEEPCRSILDSLQLKESRFLGNALARLIESTADIDDAACTTLIAHLEDVAFSNFYFVSSFDLELWRDYKANKQVMRACKEEIKINRCQRSVSTKYRKVRLAQVVLCLDAVQQKSPNLLNDCSAEVSERRRLLVDDSRITPEALSSCSAEMLKLCHSHAKHSQAVSCLIENTRTENVSDRRVSDQCARALETLLKIPDLGENWPVDPVLQRACEPVVEKVCSTVETSTGRKITCLQEYLDTKYMTSDCDIAIKQIKYFTIKNFKLDTQLFRSCRDDAVRFCHAKNMWADEQMNQGPLVLACLYRIAIDDQFRLQANCLHELQYTIHQRAVSDNLTAEVAERCLPDLANLCPEKAGKEEIMQCLVDHFSSLQANCNKAVSDFKEIENGDTFIEPTVLRKCRTIIDHFCHNEYQERVGLPKCLRSYSKGWQSWYYGGGACLATLTHFEKYYDEWNLLEVCQQSIELFCGNHKTVSEIVECLVHTMQYQSLGYVQKTSDLCRWTVVVYIFSPSVNIIFDPKITLACQSDANLLCSGVPLRPHAPDLTVKCLQSNLIDLSDECLRVISPIMASDLTDSTFYVACSHMIRQYCVDIDSPMVDCLKVHRDKATFDASCRWIVVNRMIEQNVDYRYDLRLQAACSTSVAEHCTKVVVAAERGEELGAKVVACLARQFRAGNLTSTCEQEMAQVLKEPAPTRQSIAIVLLNCPSDISENCDETHMNDRDAIGRCLIIALLKNRIKERKCKVEVALLLQADHGGVHGDPAVNRACALDLLKYCWHAPAADDRKLRCLQRFVNDPDNELEPRCLRKLNRLTRTKEQRIPTEAQSDELEELSKLDVVHDFLWLYVIAAVSIIILIRRH